MTLKEKNNLDRVLVGIEKTEKFMQKVKKRLEAIRKSIQNENVSYGELFELQNLSQYIDPSDIELREAAGIPEFDDD